ncbi:hypothetical protein NFX39_03305 [Fructobacillus sp. W13]|uniref:Uncharacterized protein n=1 Tax=Fructobacillus apis TaxID=2935017 RepID=A0ABT0ZQ63_9LACO|nr:hypothetical protein [Fructobacillus apis]MCO0832117.1 hypothetical protein [Fructobacillus apis]
MKNQEQSEKLTWPQRLRLLSALLFLLVTVTMAAGLSGQNRHDKSEPVIKMKSASADLNK